MKTHYSIRNGFMALALCSMFSITAQQSYTFTNCGATGSVGPTQVQANASYSATNLNGQVGIFGNGIQTWTVPYTGTFRIEARGAQGGSSTSPGGLGARMVGDFSLTVGEVLRILVGQRGENGVSSLSPGGGGGGSFVVRTPYTTTASILLIAGGGTGGGNYPDNPGLITTSGGMGGVAGGTNGNGGLGGTRGAGGGGFLTDGGPCSVSANYASPGEAFVNGGRGGARPNNTTCTSTFGNVICAGGFGGGSSHGGNCFLNGGAGGGYSGGGGSSNSSSGGGGSFNAGTNQINTAGNNTGDGRVIITELCSVRIYASGSNSVSPVICSGTTLTLTTDAVSGYSWSTGFTGGNSIVVSPTITTIYTVAATSSLACNSVGFITVVVNSGVPVLTVAPSSNSVCLSNTVSITASGANSYTFSGGISNGVAFTPLATTTYTIDGANACGTSSAVTTITVSALPVSASASSGTICAGNTTTLTGSGATSYTWTPGNLVGTSVIVNPQSNTIYTVIGILGNCGGTNTVEIVANPVPTISTSASNSMICQGESVTLTATGALSYTWQPGNLVGASVVVTPTAPTAYVATGENSFSCTISAQQPVITFAAPVMTISTPNSTLCAGVSAILTASGADTYTWSSGPNTTTISVNPSGTTTYSVAGTNTTTQCSSTQTFVLNVFSPNLSVTASTAICIGQSQTLIASGANNLQWAHGAFGGTIIVNPQITTTYTVNGIASDGNISCPATNTTMVSVNPLPTISAVATRSNICRNESTEIIASGASNYLWSNSATTSSITVTPTTSTTYSVVGTDENGCKNSISLFIRVNACLSITESGSAKILLQIYPNPSKGDFTIAGKESLDLQLVNELGQFIMEIKLNSSNNYTAEVKELSSGIYFLNSKGQSLSKKIIVQK